MAISRIHDFQAGTTIKSSEVDAEFNALIIEINLKPDADGTLQTNLVSQFLSDSALLIVGTLHSELWLCSCWNNQGSQSHL